MLSPAIPRVKNMHCCLDSWASILADGQGDPFYEVYSCLPEFCSAVESLGIISFFFLPFPFRLFIPQSLVSLSCFPLVPIALLLVP